MIKVEKDLSLNMQSINSLEVVNTRYFYFTSMRG